MKKRLKIENWPVDLPGYDRKVKSGLVIDVMGLLRTLEPYEEEESADFAKRALHVVINNTLYSEIHLAADRYDGIYGVFYANNQTVSLKEASGCRDRRKETEKQYEVSKRLSPKQYKDAIHNSVSKANLITFLFECWIRCSDILPENARLIMSGGFSNRLTMHAMTANGPARSSDTEEYLLSSTHEEADTRVFFHALSAIRNGCKRIIIRASDTDIVVIALYLFLPLKDWRNCS